MNQIRTYHQKNHVTADVQEKLKISKDETIGLGIRNIYCPLCGYLVERVFSDISGHKMVYCKKCKEEYPVNLGYFRRHKTKRYKTFSYSHRE